MREEQQQLQFFGIHTSENEKVPYAETQGAKATDTEIAWLEKKYGFK